MKQPYYSTVVATGPAPAYHSSLRAGISGDLQGRFRTACWQEEEFYIRDFCQIRGSGLYNAQRPMTCVAVRPRLCRMLSFPPPRPSKSQAVVANTPGPSAQGSPPFMFGSFWF